MTTWDDRAAPQGQMSSQGPTPVRLKPPAPAPRPRWELLYARYLALLDFSVLSGAVFIATAAGLGLRLPEFEASLSRDGGINIPYLGLLAAIPPVWMALLAASDGYQARSLGVGSEEFRRVVNASIRFVALLAVALFAFKTTVARGFVAVLVPSGVLLLLLGRYGARKVLHSFRQRGRCLHRVVLVGSREEIIALAAQIDRDAYAGLQVVGVATPRLQENLTADLDYPNLGTARQLSERLGRVRADTVAVAGTSAMSPLELRQLSWDLEGTNYDLLVAPALTDVTGPRIHIRPVAGLPLLHVEAPAFKGFSRIVKRALDLAISTVLLLLLAGFFMAIAAIIRATSAGPAFYRQVRVGQDGATFTIWKFRTMQDGADGALTVLKEQNQTDGPRFKMTRDPRVTKAGGFLRRYSVDELPQLLNVLSGSMSLVGPRPPLPRELESYAEHMHRRLLVKPGMTGLWQVSGRSDLNWEESIRLDLYYVENWSIALDAQILWKTIFAVLRQHGAY